MTTLAQRGQVLEDALQDEGFETRSASEIEYPQSGNAYLIWVYRRPTTSELAQYPPSTDPKAVKVQVSYLRVFGDGRIEVDHGMNNIKPVLDRIGLGDFVARAKAKAKPKALVSATNTPAAERAVRSAAAQRFGRGRRRDVFFEHGQWWVTYWDEAQGKEAAWSAVDTNRGIDFERIN